MRRDAAGPAVSVIIPSFNAYSYLRDALARLRNQTIEPATLEVIVVDDGSTDDTWAYLEQLRADWPELITFRQQNSGRPSVGRNVGLRRARGQYVFFHDADDFVDEETLELMVAAADANEADVVVGRSRWTDQAPDRASRLRAAVDADLITDGVWNSLAPHKLFRRSLLQRLELQFAEDMVQGEDQVFVAAALFGARRVTTLTDRDYYLRRRRADGLNLSRQPQTLRNKVLTSTRVAELIIRHVPAEDRAPYFDRVLLRTLAPGLGKPFQQADAESRAAGLAELQRIVLPEVTDRHYRRASDPARLRLAVAAAGTADDLVQLNRILTGPRKLRLDGGRPVYDLPERLTTLLPDGLNRVREELQPAHQVLAVRAEADELLLSLDLSPDLRRLGADRGALRLIRRGSEETLLVAGRVVDGRLEFRVPALRLAGSVEGRARWSLRCLVGCGEVDLTSNPVAWSDRLSDARVSRTTRRVEVSARCEPTKAGNVRIGTVNPPPRRRGLRDLLAGVRGRRSPRAAATPR